MALGQKHAAPFIEDAATALADEGVHAVQMELACRAYMPEPLGPVTEATWPTPYDPDYAAPMRNALAGLFQSLIAWARSPEGSTR